MKEGIERERYDYGVDRVDNGWRVDGKLEGGGCVDAMGKVLNEVFRREFHFQRLREYYEDM